MSNKNINLKTISDIKVRNDGREARLTFTGSTGQVTVTASFAQLETLWNELMKTLSVARANSNIKSNAPTEFSPAKECHLANTLEMLYYPDKGGSLDLLLQTTDGQQLQVCFLPEQVNNLKDGLKALEGGSVHHSNQTTIH